MPNDCWGGEGMYVNPYCPECGYNVTSYMWLDHIREEHGGIDPDTDDGEEALHEESKVDS